MRAAIEDDRYVYTAEIIQDLSSCWEPHDAQKLISKAIFYDGKKVVFCECGRKFGKTEEACYCLYRQAISVPGSVCYFIAPFLKQARELVWASKRIQNFLTPDLKAKYVQSVNEVEMRITFKNGSFIKLDGADNFEAYRGVNPHMVVYDEFKDHHPGFHEGMEPNLAVHDAPLLILGTPPKTDGNIFTRMREATKKSEVGAYFNFPSWCNPHLPKNFLKRMRQQLIERGEWDVWVREYEARQAPGGSTSIIPMFSRFDHCISYASIIERIRGERKRWDFYVTADPGTASVFAVLFSAVNRYTKEVVHLDEIYSETPAKSTTRQIYPEMVARIEAIHPTTEHFNDWLKTYDEAATWFSMEMVDVSGGEFSFMPTSKAQNKKESGLSLIKDQMLQGKWFCTEKTIKLMWEIENYIKDKNGKIPKVNDHLIDCMRYTNATAGFEMKEEPLPPPIHQVPRNRIEQELQKIRDETDWTTKLLGDDYYD